MPFEITAALLAVLVSAIVTGATFGFATVMEKYAAVPAPMAAAGPLVALGRRLFLMNCAHCHAADATGDEGPNLHRIKKNDVRIASIIRNGVKGEMPRFGSKFNDGDVQALISFIRSLK